MYDMLLGGYTYMGLASRHFEFTHAVKYLVTTGELTPKKMDPRGTELLIDVKSVNKRPLSATIFGWHLLHYLLRSESPRPASPLR